MQAILSQMKPGNNVFIVSVKKKCAVSLKKAFDCIYEQTYPNSVIESSHPAYNNVYFSLALLVFHKFTNGISLFS